MERCRHKSAAPGQGVHHCTVCTVSMPQLQATALDHQLQCNSQHGCELRKCARLTQHCTLFMCVRHHVSQHRSIVHNKIVVWRVKRPIQLLHDRAEYAGKVTHLHICQLQRAMRVAAWHNEPEQQSSTCKWTEARWKLSSSGSTYTWNGVRAAYGTKAAKESLRATMRDSSEASSSSSATAEHTAQVPWWLQ